MGSNARRAQDAMTGDQLPCPSVQPLLPQSYQLSVWSSVLSSPSSALITRLPSSCSPHHPLPLPGCTPGSPRSGPQPPITFTADRMTRTKVPRRLLLLTPQHTHSQLRTFALTTEVPPPSWPVTQQPLKVRADWTKYLYSHWSRLPSIKRFRWHGPAPRLLSDWQLSYF